MYCMICGENLATTFLYDLETHACEEYAERIEG